VAKQKGGVCRNKKKTTPEREGCGTILGKDASPWWRRVLWKIGMQKQK
jgi:hypothetical protein